MHTAPNIASKCEERPNLDGGRPRHPAVAHVEGLVEALVALGDDEKIFLHATRTLQAIINARHVLVREERAGTLTHAYAEGERRHLDTLEVRATRNLRERADRLAKHIRPEVRRCYLEAEARCA